MSRPATAGMEFDIHTAGVTDVDAIAPLFDAYRQFYQQPSDLAGAHTFINARLEKAESTILLARVVAAQRCAIGFVQLYPLFSSTRMQRAWVLNDLFVIPEWRRRGTGRALLLAARDFAIASGAAEMSLETAVDNHSAQAAYEQLGWKRETVFLKYNLPLP